MRDFQLTDLAADLMANVRMPRPVAVQGDEKFPAKCDVVVIGGGIIGACTALELTDMGYKVLLLEKAFAACEQSGRNWGWCRQVGRDPRELPLMQKSLALWHDLDRRVEGETGFVACGIAHLCETHAQLAKRQNWHDTHADTFALTSQMIDAKRASALTPGATISWKGGVLAPKDGRAEPQLAVPAVISAAQRKGLWYLDRCAVRSLVRTAGKVSGVATEKGDVACDAVVLAGGAWSRRFCQNEGVRLPQLSVLNTLMRSEPIEAGITQALNACDFAIRKRLDGGYNIAHAHLNIADIIPDSFALLFDFLPLLKDEWRDFHFTISGRFAQEMRLKKRWKGDEMSPFEQVRVLDPSPSPSVNRKALASLSRALPVFENVHIAQSWAGVIDVMPDAVPVIDKVKEIPGFYLSTGYSGHGFGLGPGAGLLTAQIVAGETPCVDPAPFALDRF